MKLTYFLGASMDGFIARPDGSIDWLTAFESRNDDFGYVKFYSTVGAVIMGSHTYELNLSFGSWPHPGKACLVATHRTFGPPPDPGIRFLAADAVRLLAEARARAVGGTRIWLAGGGNLAGQFLDRNLIDEIILTIVPVALGSGIPMFESRGAPRRFDLTASRTFTKGVQQLTYTRSSASDPSGSS